MKRSSKIAPDMEDFFDDVREEAPKPRRKRPQKPDPDIFGDDVDFEDVEDGELPQEQPAKGSRKPRVKPDDKGPSRPKAKKRADDVTVNSFVAFFTSTRTHVFVGIILCFLAIVSVAMCISFLSSNAADQSVTANRTLSEIVEGGDYVENAGNAVGAKVAHFLLVDTFGIGSFVLAIYLFLLGLTCMHQIKISFWSVTFRCLFSAVAISTVVGLFTMNQAYTFPPGGNHGLYINQILESYAGALGAFGVSVLLLALLVVVFFNPIKKFFIAVGRMLPKPQLRREVEEEEPEQQESDLTPLDALANSEADIEDEHEPESEPEVQAEPTENEPVSAEDEKPDELAEEEPFGFVIDEIGATTTTAGVIEGDPQSGDPDMIIKVVQNDPVADASQPIRDGDHIGMDVVYDPRAAHSSYKFPPLELLRDRAQNVVIDKDEQAANKEKIVKALRSYNIEIVRIEATIGPTVTLYEIVPAEGIRISKIKSLEDDIAMNIAATGIRIIAPIPGRGTIGIEVPNREKLIVSMRNVLESATFRAKCAKMHLPLALGSTISNEIFIEDLTKMPHLLVAGATGQGKSVGLNCIITSLLYAKHPDELKFVLVDPKMVEFSVYSKISKAFMAKLPEEENAIIIDAQKALDTLNSLCVEMDARYELFSNALVRDVESYNERFTSRKLNPENGHRYMPYLVTIVDEFADLITSEVGKGIFQPISRLAAKGRAAGIHVIIATQRPSTDVITGMIKANFPARIAFRVLSSIDSKTILDRPGAHRLIGRGDMLTLIGGAVERVQCGFVDTDEIEAVCDHIASQEGFVSCYELPEPPSEGGTTTEAANVDIRNEEFIECCRYISTQSTASISILQRKFTIGFNKAGRYIDQMEALGIVGPANGSKPRQVLMTLDSVERIFGN